MQPLLPSRSTAQRQTRERGFSLLEIAIILAIVSVVAGMSYSVGVTRLSYARFDGTQTNLKLIETALVTFQKKYQRYPCPALGSAAEGAATYGVETLPCNPASCPAGLTCSNQTVIGTLPFKTIGLNPELGLDSWGNKVTYAVDYAHTVTSDYANGVIRVNDANGNEITASSVLGRAIFLLASHGPDGKGAWTKTGVQHACDATQKDGGNCDGNDIFILGDPNDGDIAANRFDDLIRWRVQMTVTPSS